MSVGELTLVVGVSLAAGAALLALAVDFRDVAHAASDRDLAVRAANAHGRAAADYATLVASDLISLEEIFAAARSRGASILEPSDVEYWCATYHGDARQPAVELGTCERDEFDRLRWMSDNPRSRTNLESLKSSAFDALDIASDGT